MRDLALFLALLLCLFPASGLAKVIGVHVYRNQVFLEETFQVRPGANHLVLAGNPSSEELALAFQRSGFEILDFKLTTVKRTGALFVKLKELEKQQKALISQKKALEYKLKLLEAVLNGKDQVPPPATYQKYMDLLDRFLQEKGSLEERLQAIEEELTDLRERVGREEASALEILIRGPGETRLTVRYPAGQILSCEEACEVSLDTAKSLIRIRTQAVLKQTSGVDWHGVSLHFYPRSRKEGAILPPPFRPWYLDWAPYPLKALEKSVRRLPTLKAPLEVKREIPPSGVWERIDVSGVNLPTGQEIVVGLGEETFPCHLSLEVPVYAEARAYFRADFTPKLSFSRLEARFYRDGLYLGSHLLRSLFPGRKVTLYFGEAPLLEVQRKVLKDTTGNPFLRRGREVTEKVFRTSLINHYRRPFAVVVVDRLPVSKRKEIKVRATATPPWTELTPEGKALWLFQMKPQGHREITLQIEIDRPAKK